MATHIETSRTQTRSHAGHSHGHGHHHDNTYLTSSNKSDPGVRITRIGLYVNLGMAIAKGAGGYLFNSKALTADAVHALTDLVSDVMTLATISYSLRPASARFPLGYGKIESLGALAVSGVLLSGGFMIGLQAIMALSQQFFPEMFDFLSHLGLSGHGHSHGHDHGAVHNVPHLNAAWLAAGSIVVKEWLYRATMKVARKKRSSVLSSNAYHHRVDSLTAFVALFTIVASNFLESVRWLDPVGGLIISGMIVQAGWGNTKSALLEIADATMEDEVRENGEKAAIAALASYGAEVRGVQGIKSGQNLMFEVEIGVPSDFTIAQSSEVEKVVREAIAAKVRGTKRVNVRFTSQKDEPAFLDQFVSGPAQDEDPAAHDHDHNHDGHDHGHGNGHATGVKANGGTQKRK